MPEAVKPIRIFISSVQKELELERAAVASLIATDPFLLQHCAPVLFEKEPPAPRPAPQGYLATLRGCALYVLIIANEYGPCDGDLSATHHEYREAQRLKLPTIVFLKGAKDDARSPEMQALIAEAKKDGYKYVRFHDREDLKPQMAEALRRALAEEFNLKATPADVTESAQLIDAASTFEATVISEPVIDLLDQHLLNGFNDRTATNDVDRVWRSPWEALQSRGLAVRNPSGETYAPTNAAWLLFAQKPGDRLPQSEILADAYDDVQITGRPKGQTTINAPLPFALEQALKFIDDHTFHPRRVVGLKISDSTNIPSPLCARRWSTPWRTAAMRIDREKCCCGSLAIGLKSPARVTLPSPSPSRSFAKAAIAPAPAILSSLRRSRLWA